MTSTRCFFVQVSEFPQIASKSAVFGAPTITIAPPILEYDGTTVSQSTAVTMFVGQKHFPAPAGQDAVALMLMANIVDLAEGQ